MIKKIIAIFSLLIFISPECLAANPKLYKGTVLQGIIIDETQDFDYEPSQEIRILVKCDNPGEMVIKTRVTQQLSSALMNKGEKVFFEVQEIGFIDSGMLDYQPIKGKVLSVKGKALNGTVLDSDETYKSAVKRALIAAKNFGLYPLDCYSVASNYSNSPFSPLLLLMEPFYFTLAIPAALLSPITAVFEEGASISLQKRDLVEVEVCEDVY